MKKQIIYPKFVSRVFATTLDLFILSVVSSPIVTLVAKYIFNFVFAQFLSQMNLVLGVSTTIEKVAQMPEFLSSLTIENIAIYFGLLLLCHCVMMAIFFILFWRYTGSTPGKMILGMKIVDADSFQKPTLEQCVKRFCGYMLAIFGMWSIVYSHRKQAFHDKFAKTIVVKS